MAPSADLDVLQAEVGLEFEGVKGLLGLSEEARRPLGGRLAALAEDPAPGIEAGWVVPEADVELLPPTGRRPFILGCGGIFVSHLIEMGCRRRRIRSRTASSSTRTS